MTEKSKGKGGRRPTMMDVAAHAGVSQSSVSMVLNNAGGVRVSEATRERVRSAAEDLGYQVWRRRAVGSGSIQTIGLIIDDIASNPLSLHAIEAARRKAWENGCVLTVTPVLRDKALERAGIDLLLSQRLVGVIYQSFFTQKLQLPKALRTTPVILVNCYTSDPNVPFIIPEHEAGARAAVSALIATGHRRIGIINGSMHMEAARDRLAGYREALGRAGIAIDPALIRDGGWSMGGGERETAALLSHPQPPTAIFCASDQMAIGCYEAIKGRRLRVPDDISVVGFDDAPAAQLLSPQLSTVRVPHARMGEMAVDYLLARMEGGKAVEALTPRIGCAYVARASIADVRTLAGSGA